MADRDTSPGPERRRYPRINLQIPIELTIPGGTPLRTMTQEISLRLLHRNSVTARADRQFRKWCRCLDDSGRTQLWLRARSGSGLVGLRLRCLAGI